MHVTKVGFIILQASFVDGPMVPLNACNFIIRIFVVVVVGCKAVCQSLLSE